VILLLLLLVIFVRRTGSNGTRKGKNVEVDKKTRGKATTTLESPGLREGASLSDSFSKSKLMPGKRASAPSLQRPQLSLGQHFYPPDSPNWEIKSTSSTQM
jgi:hypothetical protein